MADQTPEEHIARLEAENAALRAATAGSTGPLHPDVQPRFYNGSIVHFDGTLCQVVGRSIAGDGAVTYTVEYEGERAYDVAEAALEPAADSEVSAGAHVPAHGHADVALLSESATITRE